MSVAVRFVCDLYCARKRKGVIVLGTWGTLFFMEAFDYVLYSVPSALKARNRWQFSLALRMRKLTV